MKSTESHRLNIYKIKRNELNLYKCGTDDNYDQYTFQQPDKLSQKSISNQDADPHSNLDKENENKENIENENIKDKKDDPNDFADIW